MSQEDMNELAKKRIEEDFEDIREHVREGGFSFRSYATAVNSLGVLLVAEWYKGDPAQKAEYVDEFIAAIKKGLESTIDEMGKDKAKSPIKVLVLGREGNA